ncbi:Pentatricopeptide repeat-containing protein 6, mitochondrial [Sphaceloma murrayae]|uniref:Pentatricopeptide repeat-containing protein 6, mitochondrial n=1 Tax=Sphaceloma murrayae TaxID=2082308 RepID=A0A2K1QV52_9PEZI|nr:Pentatricopeptide repeat-containing protein 6, mitochondrial [Sphaceloma murrayae]
MSAEGAKENVGMRGSESEIWIARDEQNQGKFERGVQDESELSDNYATGNGADLGQSSPWGTNWSGTREQDDQDLDTTRKHSPDAGMDVDWSPSTRSLTGPFTPNRTFSADEPSMPNDIAFDDEEIFAEVKRAIELSSPDTLMKSLLDKNGASVLPDALFTAAMRVICSGEMLEDLMRQHAHINDLQAHIMRFKPLKSVIADYINALDQLVSQRRAAGKKLSTETYAYVLHASHTVGSDSNARRYWSAMIEDGVVPDVACYNGFLGAHVWNDTLPEYRKRSRTTSFNMLARDNFYAGTPYNNYKIRESGIKELTTTIFSEMLKHKHQANEETICHVMVGLAREGDLKALQKMLSRVWDIDVDRLMRDDDRPPKPMDPTLPLYPTERLLHVMSFCYGINGSIPTALRVVDYISRNFGMTISENVWESLLQWAFVHSRPKPSKHLDPPNLDMIAVHRVWETMQMEPYKIKPTLAMFDLMVKTCWKAQRLDDMIDVMELAMQLYRNDAASYRRLWWKLDRLADDGQDGPVIEKVQRDLDHLGFKVERNSLAIKSWAKLLLGLTRSKNRNVGDPVGEHLCYVKIPALLASKFGHFFPRVIEYYIPTGHVVIEKKTQNEATLEHQGKRWVRTLRNQTMDRVRRRLGHEWVQPHYTNRRLEQADWAPQMEESPLGPADPELL